MSAAAGYTITASYLHWIVAAPLIGSVGSVLKAQSLPKEDKAGKGLWMHRHKSLGLLTGLVVAPRVALRFIQWGKVCYMQTIIFYFISITFTV